MEYSIVSNSCVSAMVYNLYSPLIHQLFVEYTNPFISSWMPEDSQYLKLCEQYEYYTSLDPVFGQPATCRSWYRDTANHRHRNRNLGEYPVMYLGDIEIHWIHEQRIKLLMNKFRGRMEISKKLEPVFLWADGEMFNLHSDDERAEMVERFCRIPHKTIFLTKYRHEQRAEKNTKVIFVPEWEGKSSAQRHGSNFMVCWYSHKQIAAIYKNNMYADHHHNI